MVDSGSIPVCLFVFFAVAPVLKSRCHDRSAYASISFEACALSVEIIVFLKTYP